MSTLVPTIDALLFCKANCIIGEGPFWHDGRLYWVDILGSSLHSCDATGAHTAVCSLPSHLGAAAPWNDDFIAATKHGVGIVSAAGDFTLLAESPALEANLRCNDGKLDPAGRFWFGTCDYGFTPGAGALYRVSRDGGVQKIVDRLILPNGLAWDNDAEHFYFIDTFTHRVDVFDFDLASGEIANRRAAFEMPRGFGLPDGMSCDSLGRLWVAFWGGSRVVAFDPDSGEPVGMVQVPTRLTSSCCVGPDGHTLYITTARNTLSPDILRAEPLAGSVFRAPLPA
jgi:sugar lactone lactonase YvrE